jgi:hypothetical protein
MIFTRVAVAGVGAVLAFGLAGCAGAASASIVSTVSPAHPIKPAIPSPVALARLQATQLLATATLPSDAIVSSSAPASAPKAALDRIACKPQIDLSSFALIRNLSLKKAVAEVSATVAGGAPDTGYTANGSGTWILAGVNEPAPSPKDELVVTMAETPAGDVAVRVDAVVTEAYATCVRHGIPAHPTPAPTATP